MTFEESLAVVIRIQLRARDCAESGDLAGALAAQEEARDYAVNVTSKTIQDAETRKSFVAGVRQFQPDAQQILRAISEGWDASVLDRMATEAADKMAANAGGSRADQKAAEDFVDRVIEDEERKSSDKRGRG